MWNGKNKAITFSFDDGVKQDLRAIEILNKYGLKATFNINSGYLGTLNTLHYATGDVVHDKVSVKDLQEAYQGHEIAVHTLTHPNLTHLDEATIVRQVEEDRKALEAICGYPVVGMAYPCGGTNNDDRVAEIIGRNTPVRYARTITSSYSFDLPKGSLLRFNPTVYYVEERLDETVDKFLALEADKPQLLYIWGHTYEMDMNLGMNWEKFDALCRKLSGKTDVFYGTNKEVLL